MNDDPDRRLLRAFHGELSPDQAETLEQELARDPGLAQRGQRLEALWRALGPPPPSQVPPFFAARVTARAEGGLTMVWRRAPSWAQATAVAASLVGFALGAGLGSAPAPTAEPVVLLADESGLADEYWELLVSELAQGQHPEGGS